MIGPGPQSASGAILATLGSDLEEHNGGVDAAQALALLQLELDLELPARAAKLIGDPSLVTEVQAEFDSSLDWLIQRLTDPGDEPVTLADVIKLDFFIWNCMPADLIEGRPAGAAAVEEHLDHVLRVVEGIVIDSAPEER